MMLKIKRVPTVVSNYQKDGAADTSRPVGGCGRNCLKACCLPDAKLPLYAFKKVVNEKDLALQECGEPPVAFLDSLLLGEWEDRMQKGLFRYDVTACETKVIPGEYGFVAQLNEGRHLKKRPTEFRVDKVLQPFDESKFNFTKVGQEEVLFQFEASDDGQIQFFPNAPVDVDNSPSFVAINVSPIEYGHVLLIPRIFECLPQRIDRESFLLALHMAVEADNPYFRLGYNSLGAFATINHLHFQAYYLALPFPIEKAPTKKIANLNGGVKISELLKYPVRGLVFEGGDTVEDLSNVVSDACICLQNNNIPFNVLISDCGKQVFLLPQCYAEKQALGEVDAELLDTSMTTFYHFTNARVLFLWVLVSAVCVWGRPATFVQDFRVAWADSHITQIDQGRAIQLKLDQNSGCGFASKAKYMFGRVSMKIKLVPGDSAGTVTAFYLNSDTDNVRDELDFEFLGNRTGQPYTVQTNVFAHGKGDREQRVNLWFDPSADFHTYSIMWNHRHIVFYVDDFPIRVYKNNERRGVPYPKMQAMGVYSTLWEADDWATRGGLEKIDWSKAPFYAYYKDFDIEGCAVPGPANCASNPRNWWEGAEYQALNAIEARRYRWVRMNHVIYDYCRDKSRYPLTPPECLAGI